MKSKFQLIIAALTLLSCPKVNFGQAPTLGTTANFALFTTVGAVTNSGTTYLTHITGNVGSNSAPTITGFGNVDGQMHFAGDPASTQCATDLGVAHGQLNAATPTLFPAPLLGNGQTLNPGVYSITNPVVTLNLGLTLDAQGNPNAVFIFQLQGVFSTNTNSKIYLINGAKACNVFWKVDGAVNIGAGTSMKGTIIAGGAIDMSLGGDTLEGRALTINGAVLTNQAFIYTPIGCGSPYLTGPIAPTLATTACYALFSSTGAVTDNGQSYVDGGGNVGNNAPVGQTTGFDPLKLTGGQHSGDASTVQCAADLGNVYAYLNGLAPGDIELLYPAQFGHNLVLTPHTYIMLAAVTFTDTLYLNAENNSNAVFVILVNGAFSTSTHSKVILINGTQARNVYWKIDGAVDINDYSVFNGTIISHGAMNLETGVILNGRALTVVGALNTYSMTVTITPGCGIPLTSIVTQPGNQTVCVGSTASFSVTATGTGITYQWRKGSVNLINGGNISGATSTILTINPVSILDSSYQYNVVIAGSPNDTSKNVSLAVNAATSIITQPTNQTVCAGSAVSFSVTATGSGITYQWRKGIVNLINGATISGATSATLTISPVNILDAAINYNVVITGACSPNVTSINVSLAVNTSPTIITQSGNQTVCVGSSVSFSVTATGGGLTYQWRKGTVNLINGGTISGATSASFTINPVNISDTASNYNVIIFGTCALNDTSKNVSLMLNSPNIIREPTNQFACSGSSASFSVTATGAGLTYQWRKGIVNLINGGTVSGATSAMLTINPVNISDTAFNYNVVISGTCGPNANSINISLMLNSLNIIAQPANQTVCAGSLVNFSITAAGVGLTYQWRKGIVNLINGATISGVTSATLTINPVNILDAASNYNVIIRGTCAPNDTSINRSLSVNPTPIAVATSNSPVCIGNSINLMAQAVSGGTYSWIAANGYTSSVQNSIILSASATDAGTYSLTVSSNGCTSASSTLTVVVNNCSGNTDLSVVKTVDNAQPIIGQTVIFTIIATNSGPNDATGVTVTDLLQSGYTYVSSTTTAGTYNPLTGVWTIATLSNGASASLTITVTVNSIGIYINTATIAGDETDGNNVNNVSTIETHPTDFFIPEGFSPNSDGINDVFIIRGILNYPENTIVIFNRWGNKVFEASPYTNTWNGRSTIGLRVGGDELPTGTYFYVFDLGNGSAIIKGTIYLNK